MPSFTKHKIFTNVIPTCAAEPTKNLEPLFGRRHVQQNHSPVAGRGGRHEEEFQLPSYTDGHEANSRAPPPRAVRAESKYPLLLKTKCLNGVELINIHHHCKMDLL